MRLVGDGPQRYPNVTQPVPKLHPFFTQKSTENGRFSALQHPSSKIKNRQLDSFKVSLLADVRGDKNRSVSPEVMARRSGFEFFGMSLRIPDQSRAGRMALGDGFRAWLFGIAGRGDETERLGDGFGQIGDIFGSVKGRATGALGKVRRI